MVLDLIDDPRWTRLVEAHQKVKDLGSVELVSLPKWNRAMDAWWQAFQPVAADSTLLARARELVGLTSDVGALNFLFDLLKPPVADVELDVPKLLADPRVALDPAKVDWAFALYIAERTVWKRDDPYETDLPGSDLARALTRVGGIPTTVAGRSLPEDPFLLQVDLGEQLRDSLSLPKAQAFIRRSPLPRGGLLQLFHTTTGDSLTDPGIPGGGATLVYLTETELRHRRLADASHECVMFPVHDADLSVAPSFTFAPHWTPDEDDDTDEKVITLQTAIDQFVRGEDISEEVSLQEAANPFFVSRQPPIRMLGVQHYDYPLEPYDAEQLATRLPLSDPDDQHVLLFTVTSEFSLDSVFGDGGILEIWIRHSDLTALRFDQIFSLIRSS